MDLDASLDIEINTTRAEHNVRRLDSDLDNLQRASRHTEGAFSSLDKSTGGMTSSFKTLSATLGAIAFGSLGNSIFETISSFEKAKASLKTMTGSTEAATSAFANLEKFASQTPFTLDQSVDSFIKLKALGLDPSEKALRSYGNTASAMGKDMNDMIEAVADASTFEFERLKEFGIKSSQQGDKVKFTFRGVTTEVQKSSENIQNYLLNIGETDFASAMSDQMQTLNGARSNLEDSIDGLFRKIGDIGVTDALTASFREASASIQDFTADLENNADFVGNYFTTVWDAWGKNVTENAESAGVSIDGVNVAMQHSAIFMEVLGEHTVQFLKDAVMDFPSNLRTAITGQIAEFDQFTIALSSGFQTAFLNVQIYWEELNGFIEIGIGNIRQTIAGMITFIGTESQNVLLEIANTMAESSLVPTSAIQGVRELAGAFDGLRGSEEKEIALANQKKEARNQNIASLKTEIAEIESSKAAQIKASNDSLEAELKANDARKKSARSLLDELNKQSTLDNLPFDDAHITAYREAMEKASAAAKTQTGATDKATDSAKKYADALAKEGHDLTQSVITPQEKHDELLFRANELYDLGVISVNTLSRATLKYSEDLDASNNGLNNHNDEFDKLSQSLDQQILQYTLTGTALEAYNKNLFVSNEVLKLGADATDAHKEKIREKAIALYDLQIATAAAQQQAEPFVKAWDEATKRMDEAFADIWKGGFDGFDDMADKIKGGFKDLLAELAHQAITKPIIMQLSGSIGGALGVPGVGQQQTGGGNFLSQAQGLTSDMSTLSNIYSGLGTTATVLGEFGSALAAGEGAAFLSATSSAIGAGASAGQAALLASQTAAFGSAGTAATTAALASSGGAAAAGAGTAAAGTAAATIGTAIPYVGAVIAVAAALGLFDSNADRTPDLGLELGNTVARDRKPGFTFKNSDFTNTIAGPFGLESSGTKHDAFSSESDAKAFAGAFDGLKAIDTLLASTIADATLETIQKSFDKAGITVAAENPEDFAGAIGSFLTEKYTRIFEHIDGQSKAFFEAANADLYGATDEQIAGGISSTVAAIAKMRDITENSVEPLFISLASTMMKDANALEIFKKEGESIGITADRMIDSLILVDGVFDKLGNASLDISNATGDIALAAADASSELISIAGGIESLASKSAFFYDNFFDDSEKQNQLLKAGQEAVSAYNEEFGDIATIASTSMQDLKSVIQGIDITADGAAEALNAALDLAPLINQLNQLDTAADNAADSINGFGTQFFDAGFEIINQFNDQLGNFITQSPDVTVDEILAKYGITGDFSAEQLDAFIAQIGDFQTMDTKEFINQLSDMGISVDTFFGDLETLDGLLNRVAGSTEGFSNSIKDALGLSQDFLLEDLSAKYGIEITEILFNSVKDAVASGGIDYDALLAGLEENGISAEDFIDDLSSLNDHFGSGSQAVDQYASSLKSLQDYLDSLQTSEISPLTPKEQVDFAVNNYLETLGKAQQGDIDAINSLQSTAQTGLQELYDFYGPTEIYQQAFDFVKDSISGIIDGNITPSDTSIPELAADISSPDVTAPTIDPPVIDISPKNDSQLEEMKLLRQELQAYAEASKEARILMAQFAQEAEEARAENNRLLGVIVNATDENTTAVKETKRPSREKIAR